MVEHNRERRERERETVSSLPKGSTDSEFKVWGPMSVLLKASGPC